MGGCRRQVDGTAGLPSALEMPCAPARARDWASPFIRTYFGIALPPASQSTIRHTLGSPPACLVIASDRLQSAITTKHVVWKQAGSCKNPFWRVVMVVVDAVGPNDRANHASAETSRLSSAAS